jgi:hypothetical protein
MPPDLELALRELEPDWPPTPDLAASVRARLAGPAPARRLAVPRAAWVAALLALLVAAGVLSASRSARSSVLRWLGLQGVEVRRAPPGATPAPVRRGAALDLGHPVTIARAQKAVPLRLPAALGPPDAIYLDGGPRVSLVYRPQAGIPRSRASGVGLLVMAFRARVPDAFLQKTIGAGARVQHLTIAGSPALWLDHYHGFAYETPGHGFGFEQPRLADRTLLVERGGVLLRIEGRISEARAIRIARSAL